MKRSASGVGIGAWVRIAWQERPDINACASLSATCAPEISASIKDALHARGVKDVTVCDTTEHLYRVLDNEIVDLLLYDYHLLGPRFVDTMQRVRRHQVGRNPFLTIIATIRDSSIEIVRRLIDAGVDDLVRTPASIDRLFHSIDKSVRRRKPFIVTCDYVGPTRPVARRDKAIDMAQVKVPNTLKSRTIDALTDENVQRIVERAIRNMASRQIQSCGTEIDRLAHEIADTCKGFDGSTENRAMRGALLRIGIVADDLRHHASGTPSENVSELAATLTPIAQRILAAPAGHAAVEVQLLSQLAAAVRRGLSVDANAFPAIREITDAVGNFARNGATATTHLSVA